MAKAVVGGALLLIAEHRIRLATLLEALLAFQVVGVAVRVILQRQLAIGALDFAVRRRARDAENFVIIAFNVSSQCSKDRRSGRPPWRQKAPSPNYLFGF
jgi:hypothetical protein